MRILVVDDEVVSRIATVEHLRYAGYVAHACETPFQALKALQQQAWDVVLTDLRMPGMDGLELLREIRRRNPDMIVFLMSAYATIDSAVQAIRAGASDYLTKPFTFSELQLRLERIEQTRRLERELKQLRTLAGVRAENAPATPQPAVLAQSDADLFRLELSKKEPLDLCDLVRQVERAAIQWALQKATGNQARAADLLRIPRTTLRSKLAALQLL